MVGCPFKLRSDFRTSWEPVLNLSSHISVHSYKNYGSGPTKYPLADMLQFVLEFATTKPTSVSPAEDLRLAASSPTPASHPLSEAVSKDNRWGDRETEKSKEEITGP